uniref:Uncharacterized protein n=1 Tax=Pararge aegeria TaxID=116150 RepID=S4NSP9_9NEOP
MSCHVLFEEFPRNGASQFYLASFALDNNAGKTLTSAEVTTGSEHFVDTSTGNANIRTRPITHRVDTMLT